MKFIDIEHDGDTIRVKAPYHDAALRRFRQLKGRFDKQSGRWVFRSEHIDLVRQALRDHYGHDDQVKRTVDVQITMAGHYAKGENEEWFGGRRILQRRWRDSPPQLGDEVILVEGKFDGSSGSMQYPGIGNVDGVVLQIRHVPADHADLEGGNDFIASMEILKEHDLAAAPEAVEQPGSVIGLVSYPGTVQETQVQVQESVVADYDLCLRIDKSTVTVDLSASAAAELADQIRTHLRLG